MDHIILQSGGFPLTTKSIQFLHSAHESAIKALTSFGGTTYILNGVEDTAGTISAGFIVYQGEVLPFDESAAHATVSIIETIEQIPYNEDLNVDGNLDLKDGYVTRKAICGAGLANSVLEFPFTDLKPAFHNFLSKYLSNVILPYVGVIANIPSGFQLCDGTNGTPDMTGAFMVGYDPADVDYDAIGKQGGAKEIAITEAQMPQHNHDGNVVVPGHKHSMPATVYSKVGASGDDNTFSNSNNTGAVDVTETSMSPDQSVNIVTANKGSSEAHENRPPYFTTAYMMFIG
ncbi:MAG: hypothetical protein PSN34_06210 [Urechidicola sp.]|nr:hypothetical protein [Urechidicola sp.]